MMQQITNDEVVSFKRINITRDEHLADATKTEIQLPAVAVL